ncbi:hypothetical protein K040078D81_58260 [Blautia hominis]|uniref:Uncharacterized protein n=1 Tax=Blautia hominis TaxID=2025493 RepID=A0ABQ0BJT5_9FIRM
MWNDTQQKQAHVKDVFFLSGNVERYTNNKGGQSYGGNEIYNCGSGKLLYPGTAGRNGDEKGTASGKRGHAL